MSYTSLNDPEFDQVVTLRDCYRIAAVFVKDYLQRGDTPVSDYLFAYSSELENGQTTDPAALDDFKHAADQFLKQKAERA